jgi:hypothetical protein
MTSAERAVLLGLFSHMIEEKRAEFFHNADDEPFVRVPVENHWENYALKAGGAFQHWAGFHFYTTASCVLPAKIFKEALEQFQAQAKFGAPELQTPLRVAEHDGAIYLDLCDAKWRCVKVSVEGWRLVDDPPIRFRRSPGMLALPEPLAGGTVEEIFRFINVKAASDKMLVLAWLLAAYRPIGPFPILALHGSQGSAKTTTETILRKMVDPAKANLSGVPRDERDLLISTRHAHLLGFDNFSAVSDKLSDALCRIATGSGLTTRKLYTDDTQTIFNACRPILLNGITDLATRGDLLDRMIVLYLPKIEENQRRDDRSLTREFEQAQPRIFGAMLDAVSLALRKLNKVSFSKLPRMADFCLWAAAGSEALGFAPEDLIAAYEQNRVEANFVALENAPAAVAIYKWAVQRSGAWEGTCRQLLNELNLVAADGVQLDTHWPKSPRGLSAVLARCEANLNAAGVVVTKLPREAGTGQRKYRISFVTSSQVEVTVEKEVPPTCDDVTVQNQNSLANFESEWDVSPNKYHAYRARNYHGPRWKIQFPGVEQTRERRLSWGTREEAEQHLHSIFPELKREGVAA